MDFICGLPIYVLWLLLAGWILRAGWRVFRFREVNYRIPTPLGHRMVTLRGGAVRFIGLSQMVVGGLFVGALIGALLNSLPLNRAFGIAFCATIPAYGLIVIRVARITEKTIRDVWR